MSYFFFNLEEPTIYSEPEVKSKKVTGPREDSPAPREEPPGANLEPKGPQNAIRFKPEPEALNVKPPEKTPEAPKTRGKVVKV